MGNEITLVDLFDHVIGTDDKESAHSSAKLHRAFSVFITDTNKMLLQKRGRDKYHSGGLWTNACCSHPAPDEDIKGSAEKRLYEETNIVCPILERFSFVYFHKFGPHLYEYEYDHVFTGQYSGDYQFDPNEIDEMKWISYEELACDLLINPEKYSVWFLIAAPEVIKMAR